MIHQLDELARQVALVMLLSIILAMSSIGLLSLAFPNARLPSDFSLMPAGALSGLLIGLGLLALLLGRRSWRCQLGGLLTMFGGLLMMFNIMPPATVRLDWLSAPPLSALMVVLTGLCLLLNPGGRGKVAWLAIGSITALVGTLSLLLYALGIAPGIAQPSYMASVLFVPLGLIMAWLGLRPPGQRILLNRKATLAAVLGVAFSCLSWYLLHWHWQQHHAVASTSMPAGPGALLPTITGLTGLTLTFLLSVNLGMLAIVQSRSRDLATAKERFRSLFTFNPDGVFMLDPKGVFVGVNKATETITGLKEPKIVGQHYSKLVQPKDHPETSQQFSDTLGGEVKQFELSLIDAQGSTRELEIINMPIVVEGQVTGVAGIARDITQTKQQVTQLRILERSLEASINGIIIADASLPEKPISYVNAAFLRISGYSRDEALGRNCRFLQGADTDPAAIDRIRQALTEGQDLRVTLRNYRKDGSPFWNDLFISPVRDASGMITHFVGVQNDISQNRDYEDQLAYHASHDALTGLANRSLLEERLRHDLIMSQHSERMLAVMVVDLDDLNSVNDTLGHGGGDKLLIAVARRIGEMVRPFDTLARLGSDEFVVMMPDLDSEEPALAFADSLLRALSRPYQIEEEELVITASIGISFSRKGVEDPTTLLQQADLAMRGAKKLGRNTFRTHSGSIEAFASRRLRLRRDMQAAIDSHQFELHYQPLICARTGRVTSCEALLRWKHPYQGYVSPGLFIPIAEETGQIIPISEWVLSQACQDLVGLHRQGFDDLKVAVNLSTLQFQRPGFLDTLGRILAVSSLPASCLELELTESILLDDSDLAIERLCSLQGMGISASIDDFGTGYSSLSYLKNLPIDTLKIDRSFVQELGASERDFAIVSGIIAMAHRLGLTVVAEGIENETQRLILEDQGCDFYQGFLFARPMPLEKLRAFLDGTP